MGQGRQQIISSGVQIGGAIWAGLAPVAMVPFIGAGVVAVGLALSLLMNRKGGKQKTAATQIANEAEQLLKRNLSEYLNGPRTRASQEAAAGNFQLTWEKLISPEFCGDPELGFAGERCISERQRGGSAPWCPTGTGCDWHTLYLDPILDDAAVQENGFGLDQIFPPTPEGGSNYLIPAAIGMIALGVLL